MANKKILFIVQQNHYFAGGLETYCRQLMKILYDVGYEIYEYATYENIHAQVCDPLPFVHIYKVDRTVRLIDTPKNFTRTLWTKIKKIPKDIKTLKYQRQQLPLIAKDFDLVIDSSPVQSSLSDRLHPKVIWVQHLDLAYAKHVVYLPRLIGNLITKVHFPYDVFHRKVLYSHYSQDRYFPFEKPKNKNLKIYLNNLCSEINPDDNVDISKKIKCPIGWFGRATDERNKRVDFANEIAKHLGQKINIYGTHYDWQPKKYKYLNFCGPYQINELAQLFNETSLSLITSDSEGFSYVGVEAITNNTPLILRNTFTDAPFLNQWDNGVLCNRKWKPQKIAGILKEILNDPILYEKLVNNTIACKKYFDIKKFEKKWIKIVEEVMNE
ncbi:glycosyltransferase [[Mycoplasma] testudinis]|uniref:glycosyltransferase n=1 Tax=[Mycoplasma] testudinis TaxID=33924 RepID=UPI000483A91A|nr:glycosyltransferase [[Mycoplasma] testudinis]